MRILFGTLLIFSAFICLAQENDFPDYRNKKESFLKIAEKDIRTDLASFTIGGIEESISKLSLQKISVSGFGDNHMTFEGHNVRVTITTGRFNPANHKLKTVEDHLVKIDNKPFYGNYGEMPRTEIQNVTVIVDKDTVPIPSVAYADLYNVSFAYRDAGGTQRTNNGVYLSRDNHKIYIYLLNRDGAGGYEVTWVVQDKKYLRRVLDFGFLK